MKYFDSNKHKHWGSKINFVDENNVLVGFDFGSDCCEEFGWFVCDIVNPDAGKDSSRIYCTAVSSNIDEVLDGWVFDEQFFEEIRFGKNSYDEYNLAVFRMIKEDQERFLHLYNNHNGYYSHGFEVAVKGELIKQGYL